MLLEIGAIIIVIVTYFEIGHIANVTDEIIQTKKLVNEQATHIASLTREIKEMKNTLKASASTPLVDITPPASTIPSQYSSSCYGYDTGIKFYDVPDGIAYPNIHK